MGDDTVKRKTLIAVVSVLCIFLTLCMAGLVTLYGSTVEGDYDSLRLEFTKESKLANPEYEDTYPSELDIGLYGRYGLYVATNQEPRECAEMGIVERNDIYNFFGRAKIIDYVISENSVGSYLMTDESGNGQYLIFYSANYQRIDRAEIKYKNEEAFEIDEDINPNFPLRYVISNLGTTENSTKQIEYVYFYSDTNELVFEYKPT